MRGTALLLFLALLIACSDARLTEYELTGGALGTVFSVKLVDPPDSIVSGDLEQTIDATLERVDNLASTWRAESELSLLNANASTDWISVSDELCTVLDNALDVSRLSGGAFDITVGPLVNLWGFGPDGSISDPPSDAALDAARRLVGYDKLQTRCDRGQVRKSIEGLYVDLSGWAKGYAVDEIARQLDARGLVNYLVEIGGEIRVRGHNASREKWAIAVEAPLTTERRPHAVLRVTDTSVATSGDYRNYFEHDGRRFSHTIDARTGRPVAHDLAAVTVVSDSAAFADAMATALLVLGPQAGPELASRLDVAGYFLVRSATGISSFTTPKFDLLGKLQ